MTYPSPFVPPRSGRAATGERVTEKLGAAMRAANSTRTNQVCHMNAIVRRTIASIATAILSMGLISACAGREEGQKMRHCSGTIIDLPSAIWAPVIDGVPFLVVNGAKATVIAGTPQADIRVYWLNGDNGLFACKGVGGVGVGRSGPECRWRRGRRAHPAASRAQLRMEGCGGEWFGAPVPRLFLSSPGFCVEFFRPLSFVLLCVCFLLVAV